MINAHGNPRGINNRGIEEIAEYISIIDRAIGDILLPVVTHLELSWGHLLLL
jgi:hypothetical protein